MTDDRRISDDEAREIWRRAVRLQGAAEHAEAQERLAPGEDTAAVHDPSALPVEQVVAAATEAGISADHVLLALAERRLMDWEVIRPERWTTRWLQRLVGDTDALEVSRFVRGPPSRVLDAIERVTGAGEFKLVAEGRYGEDPAQGIALVLRSVSPSSPFSAFHSELDIADGRVVIASISLEGEGTRLRLRAPLYRRGLNLTLAGGSAGLGGGGGAAGGVAVGGAAAGLLGAASLAGAWSGAALGLLLGGGVGVWGYRKLYSWATAKGDAAVRRLASAIATEAERDTG